VNTLLLSMLLFVADDSVVMNHGLALDRIARGGRAPVLQDPIAERFAAGTWSTPSVGDEVTLAERTVAWRSIEAGEKGTFQDGRRLAGATLVTAVDLEEGGTWILRARGHSWVRVNGEIRGGDPYSNGLLEVPVRLRAGANEFVFRVSRGKLSARLERPSASAWVVRADPTWPDLLVGTGERAVGGVVIGNATGDWRDGLSVSVAIAGGPEVESAVPTLPPHGVRKVVAELALPVVDEEGKLPLVVSLRDETGVLVHVEEFQVQARAPEKAHRRTFISEIDGSAQEYAVTPAVGAPESPALILSLHGAGVNARGQARSYGPKDWAVVVAPTNRRPFGFDWEDWGRLDALEVLDLAERTYGTDPQRTYLTGHSMGGHGTWNLGAHAADRFAAIAPSAGWRDFWSYGGAPDWEDPDPVQEILQRAANGSRTLLLEKNYSLLGVYVLHGDADDNVPVSQARFMRERLAAFHPNFAYYEKAGAGHWWGNKCVDWPPLMEFLRANERPTPAQATSFSFTTVNPGIASRGRWVEIVTQARSMHPSTVQAQLDRKGREIALATENVTRLSIDPVGLFDGDEPFSISIDGVKTDFAGSNDLGRRGGAGRVEGPASRRALQGRVSTSHGLRGRDGRQLRGERVGARQGEVRRGDVPVSRQWLRADRVGPGVRRPRGAGPERDPLRQRRHQRGVVVGS